MLFLKELGKCGWMTEKYRLVTEDWDDSYICEGSTHIPLDEVVDKLNEQDEKIELLQKHIAIFKYDLRMKDLEIEKLRSCINE